MARPKNFRYALNQKIRRIAKTVMRWVTNESKEKRLDFQCEEIERILLVRTTSRMGDSILATGAIPAFRKSFPDARIDFVGSRISSALLRNLPIDNHFTITRRFPQASWSYLVLLAQLRSIRYDFAIDLSCSQSAMGSFIVGFSGARFRVGLRGEENLPFLVLSHGEKEDGRKKINDLIAADRAPVVGVFVGGRKSWGKRWPIDNFCELIRTLQRRGINVVTFVGPEETRLVGFLKKALGTQPLVYESSSRNFAAMVSHCDLFVTCDSGPMHLASALGTRTVAIFRNNNFDHWAPPQTLARVVYQPDGCSTAAVLSVCLAELTGSHPSESSRSADAPVLTV